MATLKTAVTGYLKYRGREGQISFLLHRITGLGTLFFLVIHIVDMAAFYWSPEFFEDALALYRTPLFGVLEIALVFCVFFHGANGLRIAIVDMFMPSKWAISAERNAARWTFAIALILWAPAALYMTIRIINPAFNLFA
jgi:succinate dehydrogenase / fumarate reductase cytochrome b subunit